MVGFPLIELAKKLANILENKKMKKELIIILVLALSSCHKVAGNYPNIYYLDYVKYNDEYLIDNYSISLNDMKYKRQNELERSYYDENITYNDNYLSGGTAPRYDIVTPTNYDNVKKHLVKLELNNDKSVISTFGYLTNDYLIGYVNVFYDTIGFLSGGGNYGVEEIAYGITFKYYNQTDEFIITSKKEKCMIVSINEKGYIYYLNKKYYYYNQNKDNYLFDDMAYNSFIQHQSYTTILTNNEYAFILMCKAKLYSEKYYLYFFDYKNERLNELSLD